MLTLGGCPNLGPKYYCPVQAAYDTTGKLDTTSYRVSTDCYKSMTEKLKACYAEAAK